MRLFSSSNENYDSCMCAYAIRIYTCLSKFSMEGKDFTHILYTCLQKKFEILNSKSFVSCSIRVWLSTSVKLYQLYKNIPVDLK